jgi:hypothetical protein
VASESDMLAGAIPSLLSPCLGSKQKDGMNAATLEQWCRRLDLGVLYSGSREVSIYAATPGRGDSREPPPGRYIRHIASTAFARWPKR